MLKATEPIWSALLLAVFFQEFLPVPVYLSLVPIIGGVALASLKELSFSWLSFTAAVLSAVASASKAILSKKASATAPQRRLAAGRHSRLPRACSRPRDGAAERARARALACAHAARPPLFARRCWTASRWVRT